MHGIVYNKKMEILNYKNYDCLDSISVKESLANYGVAVIPNVLNENEINNMEDGIWDTLNYITKNFKKPILKNNIKTWKLWNDIYPKTGRPVHDFTIGHCQFVWDVRQNPKVVKVFSDLWNCEPYDLITSFDALSFHIPPEKTGYGWYDGNDWFHIDSKINSKSMECVQGLVTAFDINEGDGTLSIIEGSHKYHEDYFRLLSNRYPNYEDISWNSFNKEELLFFKEKGCERFQIKATKGSVILWDSKTIHCGVNPQKNRKNENFRLVCYVCMSPRSIVNEHQLQARRIALENLYMTGHCPYNTVFFRKTVLYPENPELEPVIPFPNLTNLGKRISNMT